MAANGIAKLTPYCPALGINPEATALGHVQTDRAITYRTRLQPLDAPGGLEFLAALLEKHRPELVAKQARSKPFRS